MHYELNMIDLSFLWLLISGHACYEDKVFANMFLGL